MLEVIAAVIGVISLIVGWKIKKKVTKTPEQRIIYEINKRVKKRQKIDNEKKLAIHDRGLRNNLRLLLRLKKNRRAARERSDNDDTQPSVSIAGLGGDSED